MEKGKEESFHLISCINLYNMAFLFLHLLLIFENSQQFKDVVDSWVNVFFFMFLVSTLYFSVYFLYISLITINILTLY